MQPEISIVLTTDSYETIRRVVEHLRRQTVNDRLELIIAAPDRQTLGMDESEADGLGRVQVVEVGLVETFSVGRAAGVRAATAPIIVIGETHTYPHPGWAEALIRAHAQPWAVVVPGFGNANPDSALSWSLFLLDYGRWSAGLPPGRATLAPTHNSSYKRRILLGLGGALESTMAHGDEMALSLDRNGHQIYFEPSARIDHLNIARPGPWLRERFLGGVLIAGRRAARWPWWTRLAYFGGSPLIPAVLLFRLRHALRAALRNGVPAGTVPLVVAGAIVSATGEAYGYLRGARHQHSREMTEYELHKARYATP